MKLEKNYIKIISNNIVDYLLQLRCWLVMMPQISIKYLLLNISFIFIQILMIYLLFLLLFAVFVMDFAKEIEIETNKNDDFFGFKIVSMKINRSI